MADLLTSIVDNALANWYWFLIVGLGIGAIYFYFQSRDKDKDWSVVFKKVFKKGIIDEERLNKSKLKFIYRGPAKVGKILKYSEMKLPVEIRRGKSKEKIKRTCRFGTVVFHSKEILGLWYDKSIMRFLIVDGYPAKERNGIKFHVKQTFKEKDGFYVPIVGDAQSYELLMNNIMEDIQKFDKDRTLDINASSMQKLSGLPPDWAHQEKMRELDLEFLSKYKKGIGWKAG